MRKCVGRCWRQTTQAQLRCGGRGTHPQPARDSILYAEDNYGPLRIVRMALGTLWIALGIPWGQLNCDAMLCSAPGTLCILRFRTIGRVGRPPQAHMPSDSWLWPEPRLHVVRGMTTSPFWGFTPLTPTHISPMPAPACSTQTLGDGGGTVSTGAISQGAILPPQVPTHAVPYASSVASNGSHHPHRSATSLNDEIFPMNVSLTTVSRPR